MCVDWIIDIFTKPTIMWGFIDCLVVLCVVLILITFLVLVFFAVWNVVDLIKKFKRGENSVNICK